MKIIVETEEQKQELLRQSEYIHDFLISQEDVENRGENLLIGLDPNKAGILMHLYMAPQVIEVQPTAEVMNKERRIINVEVPKEIWDAHMSIWNWRRDIMGAWMNSIKDVIKQMQKK